MLIGAKEIGLELEKIGDFSLSSIGFDSISGTLRLITLKDTNPNHPFVYKPGIWSVQYNGFSFSYGKFNLSAGESVLNVINHPLEELALLNPSVNLELWLKIYRSYVPGNLEARIRSFS